MDFIQFASAHGLEITNLVAGKITRCRTSDHRSKKNGSYYFEHDWGWAMNWTVHDKPEFWKSGKVVDTKELQLKIKKSQEKHQQERARLNLRAIRKSEWALSKCRNDISAYLASKGFPEMCFNMLFEDDPEYPLFDGRLPLLCVPMKIGNKLSGLQMIANDGAKKFIYGTNAELAIFDIGNGSDVFLVEGLATGLSLQKILSQLKVSYKIRVCFSAGNMIKVAKLHKDPILICDNDQSGVGERVGIESGKLYYMPPITGQDLNDECNKSGYFVVSQKIKKMLHPKL